MRRYDVRYSNAESANSFVGKVFDNSERAKEFRETASLYGELLDNKVVMSSSDGRHWIVVCSKVMS
jgi:hypothetical protein